MAGSKNVNCSKHVEKNKNINLHQVTNVFLYFSLTVHCNFKKKKQKIHASLTLELF